MFYLINCVFDVIPKASSLNPKSHKYFLLLEVFQVCFLCIFNTINFELLQMIQVRSISVSQFIFLHVDAQLCAIPPILSLLRVFIKNKNGIFEMLCGHLLKINKIQRVTGICFLKYCPLHCRKNKLVQGVWRNPRIVRKVCLGWKGHGNQKSQQPHPARRRTVWPVRANVELRNGTVDQQGNPIEKRAQKFSCSIPPGSIRNRKQFIENLQDALHFTVGGKNPRHDILKIVSVKGYIIL